MLLRLLTPAVLTPASGRCGGNVILEVPLAGGDLLQRPFVSRLRHAEVRELEGPETDKKLPRHSRERTAGRQLCHLLLDAFECRLLTTAGGRVFADSFFPRRHLPVLLAEKAPLHHGAEERAVQLHDDLRVDLVVDGELFHGRQEGPILRRRQRFLQKLDVLHRDLLTLVDELGRQLEVFRGRVQRDERLLLGQQQKQRKQELLLFWTLRESHEQTLENPGRVLGLAANLLAALFLAHHVLDKCLAPGKGIQLLIADVDCGRYPRHGRNDLFEHEQVERLALLQIVGHELRERGDLNVPLRSTDDAGEERQPLKPLLEVDAVFFQLALSRRQLLDDGEREHVEGHRCQVLERLGNRRNHARHAHDLPQQLPAHNKRIRVGHLGQQSPDRSHRLLGVLVVVGWSRHPAQNSPGFRLSELL